MSATASAAALPLYVVSAALALGNAYLGFKVRRADPAVRPVLQTVSTTILVAYLATSVAGTTVGVLGLMGVL